MIKKVKWGKFSYGVIHTIIKYIKTLVKKIPVPSIIDVFISVLCCQRMFVKNIIDKMIFNVVAIATYSHYISYLSIC